ncbi:hypothetical protein PG996_007718 [Apiospora saccharicola]|uniref:WW domain-containing protein n=1 Tax=Apiospora saccharicola TaxID=335842 RepID=A0ABR1VBN6_9PEZI
MVTHATRDHEIFQRLRGSSAFYVYVALEMNPLAPHSAADVEFVFLSLEAARKRAQSTNQAPQNAPKSRLLLAMDVILKLRQKANDLGRADHIITLKPQPSSRPSMLRGPSPARTGTRSPVTSPALQHLVGVSSLREADAAPTRGTTQLALPVTWEQKCFRSGMTIIINEDGTIR